MLQNPWSLHSQTEIFHHLPVVFRLVTITSKSQLVRTIKCNRFASKRLHFPKTQAEGDHVITLGADHQVTSSRSWMERPRRDNWMKHTQFTHSGQHMTYGFRNKVNIITSISMANNEVGYSGKYSENRWNMGRSQRRGDTCLISINVAYFLQ